MTMVGYEFPIAATVYYLHTIHTYNSCMRPIGSVQGGLSVEDTLGLSEWADYGGGHISGVLTGSILTL